MSSWRNVASKAVRNAPEDDQRCPDRPQSLTFLEQIGERGALVKNSYLLCFHDVETPLSTVTLLTALGTECGPKPAFLRPLALTGAPKCRRSSA